MVKGGSGEMEMRETIDTRNANKNEYQLKKMNGIEIKNNSWDEKDGKESK